MREKGSDSTDVASDQSSPSVAEDLEECVRHRGEDEQGKEQTQPEVDLDMLVVMVQIIKPSRVPGRVGRHYLRRLRSDPK